MKAKTSTWVGGTIVVAVLVAALAWFLAISPTLADAASARTGTADAEARNVQLQAQLNTLKEQAAGLETTKAELAVIGGQIPDDIALAEYVRTVQSTAEAAGVAFLSYTAGEPTAVFPAAPLEAPPAEPAAEGAVDASAATTAPEGDATDGTSAPAAPPVGFVPVEGFAGTELSLTVVGPVANMMTFVERMQTANERLFLVTAYSSTGLDAAEAAGGRPAVQDGDMELVLTGYVYMLAPLTVPSGQKPVAEPAMPAPAPPRLAGN